MPIITIAIPVYERYEGFEDALQSAINQTDKVEIIIVDNNSSHKKFEEYVLSINKPNIRYICNDSNVGMINNWNRCIDLASSDWVSILHSDDMLSKDFAKIIYTYINKNSDAITFMTNFESGSTPFKISQNASAKPLYPPYYIKPFHFLFGNPTAFPGVVFNKKKIKEIRFKAENYPIADYIFWYELCRIAPIKYINIRLAFYRISEIQESNIVYKDIVRSSFFFRKNAIGFKNYFFKIFSFIDLFMMLDNYRTTHGTDKNYDFLPEELSKYFVFFDTKILKKVIILTQLVFRKVITTITGIR